MTKYSKEQRARIMESYFTHDGSLVAVQRDFMTTFNQRKRPCRHCIITIISKSRESGSTADMTMPILGEAFPGKVISRSGDVSWF